MGAGNRRGKRKREGEKGNARERAGALESVICVTRGAGAICPTTQINQGYSQSCLRYGGQLRKGGERTLSPASLCRAELAPRRRRAFGEGAVLLGKPSGPRTPGARQVAAFSAAARSSLGWRPPRPLCLFSGCTEHKALSPIYLSRSLFSAEPDPPKRRICT